MGDAKDRIDEVVARLKDVVGKEVEQHKNEDVNLEDLEDVSGGWGITYSTDPATDQNGKLTGTQT
jgi:hypothetical protein